MSFSKRIIIVLICLTVFSTIQSCTSAKHSKSYAWQDLPHARDLDKKKGKQSKKNLKKHKKKY